MKFKLHITQTIEKLLAQEDTDGDKKITIDDHGPKKFLLNDESGNSTVIEGTYQLSNLLQELALAKKNKTEFAEINLDEITEDPVKRISRKIKTLYWKGLTRTIDADGVKKILEDNKIENELAYLYVPFGDEIVFDYFKKLEAATPKLKVVQMPKNISPEYVLSLNKKPGILALALQIKNNVISGVPFVVPGGRFNEMYGWDSYFIAKGLLIDDKIDLALGIAENFKYQIDHYGKILNANRSYYLTRTQPPLYTSLIMDVLEKSNPDIFWIERHLKTAIKEYQTVWMEEGKRLTANGLNRYKAEGIGLPFEVEEGHFDDILEQYAPKYNLSTREFEKKYLEREVVDPELDKYFIHDRSMRESGHDTTNRLVGVCANLNTVAINSLLYKYETDIAFLIKKYFKNEFQYFEDKSFSSEYWLTKANSRKEKINTMCWNPESGCYLDYDFVNEKQHFFEAAPTFYPLWAKISTPEQAEILVKKTLPRFKMKGGIAGCTKESIADVDENAPIRQWDYPFGWAPHQMLLWEGLLNYNFYEEAQEMVYRWLWLITRNAVDYNGTIPEKFDLSISSHKIFAEYGNVGTEFDYITEEGFGWMNASYQYGLTILEDNLKQKLSDLVDPDELFS
ncbi:alpha,alpha-trehalase [Flavobacterium araucananum]|jgi:alpha,alpha-trehalase|uniref:Trehalase n=1 Tax=Flavobacterium araucananum TaxID=946678 RepID=A0A227PHP0_9FLAO|nr:trehalase family glycosidase [Flavobacterium araucananum]OXG09342.1 trehalase [Flavobacterium araucananum]PWK02716.1 alpha,alpha-trehalase [Flavobacterium araucananum]